MSRSVERWIEDGCNRVIRENLVTKDWRNSELDRNPVFDWKFIEAEFWFRTRAGGSKRIR